MPSCPIITSTSAHCRAARASARRACGAKRQLRERDPLLSILPLRGNVNTRLRKLDEGGTTAIILAAAGLRRLGLAHRISAYLDPEESLPATGQGALAIECRADRRDLIAALAPLGDRETTIATTAERAFARKLPQLPHAARAYAIFRAG
jgi:hydroxymethylbilane synthase